MTSNAELGTAAAASDRDQARVLLVEDDDGDALLVEELLRDVDAPVVVLRARSLGQATAMVAEAACVLLDLGLLEREPEAAIVVLTGEANEHLGEQAVRAGAQDYLVKGEVAGHMLHRVIRYAVERRRAEGRLVYTNKLRFGAFRGPLSTFRSTASSGKAGPRSTPA